MTWSNEGCHTNRMIGARSNTIQNRCDDDNDGDDHDVSDVLVN